MSAEDGTISDEPSEEAVRAAVAATGDDQLVALFAGPGSFVLRPAAVDGAQLRIFEVIALRVAHAAGIRIAYDPSSGRTEVVSGRPAAVAWVLSGEPGLARPDSVWELIREPSVGSELVTAESEGSGAGRDYRFEVREPSGESVRWVLTLSEGGRLSRLD